MNCLFSWLREEDPRRLADRIQILRELRSMGYQIGGGILVGLPGQTYASLLQDLQLFAELDLDMIGIGPFIPHPHTPLGKKPAESPASADEVPPTELMT